MDLKVRPRRLRQTEGLRRMVRETRMDPSSLIYPMFVMDGKNRVEPIEAMPGQCRWTVDRMGEVLDQLAEAGVASVMLFGIPDRKDEIGSEAYAVDGIVQRAVQRAKMLHPEMYIITDVCMCEYTSHGHCGLLCGHDVDNDRTLPVIAKIALSHVEAGADMVAPSDMMDGRVAAIRAALDEKGFKNTSIMSYAVKYASGYYGPFRDAADSAPQFGDRRQYQMDPANRREALKEVDLDIAEGADIIMVKPALAYLDIVREVRDRINFPVATYNVSGEYAMVKAAAANGWIDEKRIVLETLTSMKRAGADIIITYHAIDAAKWLKE